MQHRLSRLPGFLRYTAVRMIEDRLPRVAASLTFTTLLSLVPLLTIAVALIAAFPAFSEVGTQFKIFLLTTMVPEAAGKIITVYMEQFADAAARLTAVGIVFLGITAMMLMLTIDDAFNAIWRVKRPRPLLQRLLIYWAVLTLGPLLMGLSLSLTSWLVSVSLGLTRGVPALGKLLLGVTPFILTTAAFTLLFLAVPNRYVPRSHALTGGAVAALAFEVMKRGFGFYIASVPTYKLVYGAFASIPIFLLWIYLSWLIVLAGAVITASLTGWRGGAGQRAQPPGERFHDALRVLRVLYDGLRSGETVNLPRLARELQIAYEDVDEILGQLARAHWVQKAVGDGWLLARDPEQIRVSDVYRSFVFRHEAPGTGARDERIEALLGELDARHAAELDMTLRQLFGEPRAVERKRAAGAPAQ